VDFDTRAAMVGSSENDDLGAVVEGWRTGAMKLHVLKHGLALRQRAPALLAEGEYLPLPVEGPEEASVIAFSRRRGEDWVMAVAPCRPLRLTAGSDRPQVPGANWRGTALVLPTLAAGRLVNLLTGEDLGAGGRVPLATLLGRFPVALIATVPA
jgi:(1->4)-alpha-D-glucan 1-alpha-D-glucosylmutase